MLQCRGYSDIPAGNQQKQQSLFGLGPGILDTPQLVGKRGRFCRPDALGRGGRCRRELLPLRPHVLRLDLLPVLYHRLRCALEVKRHGAAVNLYIVLASNTSFF